MFVCVCRRLLSELEQLRLRGDIVAARVATAAAAAAACITRFVYVYMDIDLVIIVIMIMVVSVKMIAATAVIGLVRVEL